MDVQPAVIDRSELTYAYDWWQTLQESFIQYHHGYTDQLRSFDGPEL